MNEKPIPRTEGITTADLARRGEEARDVPDTQAPTTPAMEEQAAPLFSPSQADNLRSRWDSVQAGFVDEPRKAVQEADALVAEAMRHLAETFSDERAKLEGQWDRGDDVSTEDLRIALRRYRSFFQRLLSI
jgi:hypothetical protein